MSARGAALCSTLHGRCAGAVWPVVAVALWLVAAQAAATTPAADPCQGGEAQELLDSDLATRLRGAALEELPGTRVQPPAARQTKITRALYRVTATGGDKFVVGVTCTLKCSGTACSLSGCDLVDGDCTTFTCSGLNCASGSCTKTTSTLADDLETPWTPATPD